MNHKTLMIIVSIVALVSVALIFHTMKLKLYLSPRVLCHIRSSCAASTQKAESFKYPESMSKNIIVMEKEGSMDCVSLLEESKQCLNQHLQDMMAGAPAEYLASSASKCFDLISRGQQCILASPTTSSPSIIPMQIPKAPLQMPEIQSSPSMPASLDIEDEDISFPSRKRVRFQDQIHIQDTEMDLDHMFDNVQGPSIPMPLLDLTQMFDQPQQQPQLDTSVECISINGKTYCQVTEMI